MKWIGRKRLGRKGVDENWAHAHTLTFTFCLHGLELVSFWINWNFSGFAVIFIKLREKKIYTHKPIHRKKKLKEKQNWNNLKIKKSETYEATHLTRRVPSMSWLLYLSQPWNIVVLTAWLLYLSLHQITWFSATSVLQVGYCTFHCHQITWFLATSCLQCRIQ